MVSEAGFGIVMNVLFGRSYIIAALGTVILCLCAGVLSLTVSEGGAALQESSLPALLQKIRVGDHGDYVSIVFDVSRNFNHDAPQIRGDRFHCTLKNVTTTLPSLLQFRNLDAWAGLKPQGADIAVTIGLPQAFSRSHTFVLADPPRLVVNIYRDVAPLQKQRLTAYRAGRHEGYSSVVFQFSHPPSYDRPIIEGDRIGIRFRNVMTSLAPFRKFDTAESWVRISRAGGDLDVSLGIPPGTGRHHIFQLQNPHRLVLNLYRQKATDGKPRGERQAPLIAAAPVTAQPPVTETSAPDPVVTDAGKSTAPPPSPADTTKYPLFSGNDRQRGLIRARILSRRGLTEQSLKMYRLLRERYPDDEEIWIDYIETLVNAKLYELALHETEGLYRKNPSSLRARRIEARIYTEHRRYRWTFPIYESLLRNRGDDAGIWSDYAYARQDAGDWPAALNYFSRVLELDPDNTNALRNVHAILKEHRPQLETGYRFYSFSDGDASFGTYTLNYNRHLGRDTRLYVTYSRIDIDRSLSPGVTAVDTTIDDVTARLKYHISPDWQVGLGAGLFSGIGGDASLRIDTEFRPWNTGVISAGFLYRRPWYDPIEAAEREGRSHSTYLSLFWNVLPAWDLYLNTEYTKYLALRDGMEDRDYGRKRTWSASLSRQLFTDPDLSVSYSYYRSRFNYEDDSYTPISMLDSEGVHSLSFRFEHRPCTYWSYGLSGGVRRDHIRTITSWYFRPDITLRLGNRIEGRIDYEYSNEEDSVAGGHTHTINLWLKAIF